MAQIRSVGPGVRSKGKVDGLVYVHINGKTYARSLPIMPAGMYKTPEARKRQALFKLSQLYIKHHAGTIIKSFDKFGSWSSRTAFCKANGKALNKAFEHSSSCCLKGKRMICCGNIFPHMDGIL